MTLLFAACLLPAREPFFLTLLGVFGNLANGLLSDSDLGKGSFFFFFFCCFLFFVFWQSHLSCSTGNWFVLAFGLYDRSIIL